jgi:hypothetical protein
MGVAVECVERQDADREIVLDRKKWLVPSLKIASGGEGTRWCRCDAAGGFLDR